MARRYDSARLESVVEYTRADETVGLVRAIYRYRAQSDPSAYDAGSGAELDLERVLRLGTREDACLSAEQLREVEDACMWDARTIEEDCY